MFDEISVFQVKLVLDCAVEDYDTYKSIRAQINKMDIDRKIQLFVEGLLSNIPVSHLLKVKTEQKK